VNIELDRDSCTGHGRCYTLAPDLFAPDDNGYGTVVGDGTVPAGLEDQARTGVKNCPEHAIRILESDST